MRIKKLKRKDVAFDKAMGIFDKILLGDNVNNSGDVNL